MKKITMNTLLKQISLAVMLVSAVILLAACSAPDKGEKATVKSTEAVAVTEEAKTTGKNTGTAVAAESADPAKIMEEARALCNSGKYTEAAELYCRIPGYTEDEKTAIRYFAVFYPAIKSGNSFDVKNINSDSAAKKAATYIEKNCKTSSSKIVRQIYLAAEAVLYTSITVYWEPDLELIDKGIEFGRQIDQSYSGPFDIEIIELARFVTK